MLIPGCRWFLFAGLALLAPPCPAVAQKTDSVLKIDFGGDATTDTWTVVGANHPYSPTSGIGWTAGSEGLEIRDRMTTDPIMRDFVYGTGPATLQIDLPAGRWRIGILMGDACFGDHVLRPILKGYLAATDSADPPLLKPGPAQGARYEFSFEKDAAPLEFLLGEGSGNWIINGLCIEPALTLEPPHLEIEAMQRTYPDTWTDAASQADPTERLWAEFLSRSATAPIQPTGLNRGDYLALIEGNVDYFRRFQDERGAIIDPFMKVEWQYSTPAYALAAATVVLHGDRVDLLESAALAMDWSCATLSRGEAATRHEDFFPPLLAAALPLLEPHVEAERGHRWRELLAGYDPFAVYRSQPGGNNWNVVAASGEWLLHRLGLRDNLAHLEASILAQGRFFASPWGLYMEGPMAYDHFPRIWAGEMIAAGYDGPHAADLAELLRRAAITSLFMQSPSGELPVGGRSAQHQWNEAEQCMTYERCAAAARSAGDLATAAIYKRAAHLALGSIRRWQRPTGELWIVKNRVDPVHRHGYEGYSAHSQYNLLPMAMLAFAWQHAETTEGLEERPAPADLGGYLLDLREFFGKVIANAGGTYVEVETAGDPAFNPTGLLRVHFAGVLPQLGTSDGLVEHPHSQYPDGPGISAAIGPAWRAPGGDWLSLAGMDRANLRDSELVTQKAEPAQVSFTLTHHGDFDGPSSIIAQYRLTPGHVEICWQLEGHEGPQRLQAPVLAHDGAASPEITVEGNRLTCRLGGESIRYEVPASGRLECGSDLFPNRNGWLRLAESEGAPGTPLQLGIGITEIAH